MAKTSIIIPLFCVSIIYSDMHRVNASPGHIYPPFLHSHTFVKGDLWVTVTARNLSVLLNVFAPNVLSEGVCQAEE